MRRGFSRTNAIVGACALVLVMLGQAPVAASPVHEASSVVHAAARSKAGISAVAMKQPSGRVLVTVRSNARHVKVRYATKRGRLHVRTLRVRSGAAHVLLAAGSRSIRVRAVATKRLSATRWSRVAISAPTATPTLTPPPPTPTEPLAPPPTPTEPLPPTPLPPPAPPVNQAPVANAGPDQTVAALAEVTLTGAGSSDPDGDTVAYAWTQVGGPPVTLSASNVERPTFTAPSVSGTLTFSLVVRDGVLASPADTVTITVDRAPVADAGPDQSVGPGSVVTLTGADSTDPDGDPLTYAWTQTGGPAVTLSAAADERPTFTAPAAWEILTFSLVVRDGALASPADTVTVRVDRAPVADAGPDQTVAALAEVTLTGAGSSDPDGDTVAYAWTQVGGPPVTLSASNVERPTFTAPSVSGTLTFSLVVRDGVLASPVDTVTITVDRAPVADAGPDQSVGPGAVVTLTGADSTDPDGDPLTYAWTQTGGPAVTLSAAADERPTFTAPAAWEILTFSLVVRDGVLASPADTVTVRVDRAPVADAGPDQTVAAGAVVTLTGAGSSDPDGDTVAYAWTQTAGPEVSLSASNVERPTFTAPSVSGTLTFSLVVRDGVLASPADTVTITVDRAPVADAGADQSVAAGAVVTLTGAGSTDPDGDPLTYAWTQTAGPEVSLSASNVERPTFTAPSVSGTLTFSLVVRDGVLASPADTVTITVDRAPVADAGPDQSVGPGAVVTLTGADSTDPDGDPLTYAWTQTGGPAVTLSAAADERPTFTAPAAWGILTFSLVVRDGVLASPADTVTVRVDRAPVADAGPDQTVAAGAVVTLTGAGSSDPDGDTVAYAWTQVGGPAVTLSAAADERPTFTAPAAWEILTFSLVVRDGVLASPADTVTVRVDRAPVADAGPDQTVAAGAVVTLTGAGSSDPDGDTVAYAWTQTAGPEVSLSASNVERPTFTAPSVSGTLTFSLVVRDGVLASPADTVTITVDRAPVADAGADQSVGPGAVVTLTGADSTDPDGDPLTYAWTQTGGPAVTLSAAADERPTFTAPAAWEILTFSLVVRDGVLASPADTVTVRVDRAPVADAGPDQTVAAGAVVTLTGAGSSDPDGDTVAYAWTQTAGPEVSLSASNVERPTFTAPSVSGTLTFSLVVRDGVLASPADTVTITVDRAPVADAGADQSVGPGAVVTLTGAGSTDPDGDPLTYAWTQTGGPAVTLSSADARRPTFTAPGSGTLTFSLVVRDGVLDSPAATVTVTADRAPVVPVDSTIISTGQPAFASVGVAGNANDGDYSTWWEVPGGQTGELAYDLSGVAAQDRRSVVLAWYSAPDDGFTTEGLAGGCPAYGGRPLLGDYVVEVNSAAGGEPPTSGWREVATVTGNLNLSGQHLVDLSGANWIRVLGRGHRWFDGYSWIEAPVRVNVDVAAANSADSGGWLFLGDSITAGYSGHALVVDPAGAVVPGIGQLIASGSAGRYQPLVQDNGVACSKSSDALIWIDQMLDGFHGHYVTLNFGGNDGYGGQGNDPAAMQAYYQQMEQLVAKVTARGMVPVIPTVTWPNNPGVWDETVQKLNDQIRRLYGAHPEVVPGPDLYALLVGRTELYHGVGDVHPTEQGAALIRKAWAETMLTIVYHP